jgi:uracil-DNA glycosylase family 4
MSQTSEKQKRALLNEMGIGPQWVLRQKPEVVKEAAPLVEPETTVAAPANASDRDALIDRMGWDELKQSVAECRVCGLCKERKQAVLGVGDTQADWLFVGEGPGAEEDERGEPFVGAAGKLLDAMMDAIDLKRGKDVYIANAVKCRPPGNRTPTTEETAACRPYLQRQIDLLKPRLIVVLGGSAAQTLLNAEVKVGAMRGKLLEYSGIPMIVTYHPAYLLRTPTDKIKVWEDLLFARKTMRGLKQA